MHKDFKSQNGEEMILGRRVLNGILEKEITEGKLVAVDDASTQIIWASASLGPWDTE